MVEATFIESRVALSIRTPAGNIRVGKYRVKGSYLRPFTVWLGDGTLYYPKRTVAGAALTKNANLERVWLGRALVAAGAPAPLAYVGV